MRFFDGLFLFVTFHDTYLSISYISPFGKNQNKIHKSCKKGRADVCRSGGGGGGGGS